MKRGQYNDSISDAWQTWSLLYRLNDTWSLLVCLYLKNDDEIGSFNLTLSKLHAFVWIVCLFCTNQSHLKEQWQEEFVIQKPKEPIPILIECSQEAFMISSLLNPGLMNQGWQWLYMITKQGKDDGASMSHIKPRIVPCLVASNGWQRVSLWLASLSLILLRKRIRTCR